MIATQETFQVEAQLKSNILEEQKDEFEDKVKVTTSATQEHPRTDYQTTPIDTPPHPYISHCKTLQTPPCSILLTPSPTISLSYRALSATSISAIALSLHSFRTLTHLDLSYNNASTAGTLALAEALSSSSCTLLHLNLAYNNITNRAIQSLCDTLRDCSVKSISLAGNHLSDREAIHIAQCLQTSELQSLDLSYNAIGERGITEIARVIATNEYLKELDLSWNVVRAKSVVQLMNSLKENQSLQVLRLRWDGIAEEGGKATGLMLAKNNSIQVLDVRDCGVTDAAVVTMAKALDQNYVLKELLLGGNVFGNVGSDALFKAVPNSNCLKKLNLVGIKYSKEVRAKYDEMRNEKPDLVVVE